MVFRARVGVHVCVRVCVCVMLGDTVRPLGSAIRIKIYIKTRIQAEYESALATIIQ